jgi:hypothetical protein
VNKVNNEMVTTCVASFMEAYAKQDEERLQDWATEFAELTSKDALSVWNQLTGINVNSPEELERAKTVHRLAVRTVLPYIQALAISQGEM